MDAMTRPGMKTATLIVLIVLIAAAPLVFSGTYHYRVATLVFINAIAVTGLVVLIGYAGQVSLGHAGFFGIGAYACAIGATHFGVPPLACIAIGAVLSGAIAYAVGRPILRLKGYYLAVATLGFGILVAMALTNEAQWTGGPDGMIVPSINPRGWFALAGLKVKTAVAWYWLAGTVMIVGAWIALNLKDSTSGRALRALHDSEIAARVAGVDVTGAKLQAFVISAVYASVAGSLFALFNQFITPDAADFLHSIELVTMTVLGGAGMVLGGIVGAALLTILPQALTVFQDYESVALGVIMIAVMIFLGRGLVPSLANALRRRPA
nr:branched-chain amino acid ABC transporter permease [Kaustia mangrovi]